MENAVEYYPQKRMLVFRDGQSKIRKVYSGPMVAEKVRKRMKMDRANGFCIN